MSIDDTTDDTTAGAHPSSPKWMRRQAPPALSPRSLRNLPRPASPSPRRCLTRFSDTLQRHDQRVHFHQTLAQLPDRFIQLHYARHIRDDSTRRLLCFVRFPTAINITAGLPNQVSPPFLSAYRSSIRPESLPVPDLRSSRPCTEYERRLRSRRVHPASVRAWVLPPHLRLRSGCGDNTPYPYRPEPAVP